MGTGLNLAGYGVRGLQLVPGVWWPCRRRQELKTHQTHDFPGNGRVQPTLAAHVHETNPFAKSWIDVTFVLERLSGESRAGGCLWNTTPATASISVVTRNFSRGGDPKALILI